MRSPAAFTTPEPKLPAEPVTSGTVTTPSMESLGGQTASTVNSDPLLYAEAAANYLGLVGVVKHPGQAVRRLCRTRQLASVTLLGKVAIRRSELERYIREHTRTAREG